jgi:transposase
MYLAPCFNNLHGADVIAINFTEDDVRKLKQERFSHPSPKVQLKMEALYLKSKDLTHGQICDICDITRATLASYLKAYVAGGVEELKELNYEGRKNELLEHSKSIEGYFTQTPPRSLKEARAKIEELTGIRRSLPQIWKFFRRMEFKYRKIRAVPGKALTPEKRREQDDFVAEKLSPRVEEAKRGERNFFLWMPPTSSTKRS